MEHTHQVHWYAEHLGGTDQIASAHLGAVDPQITRRQLDQPLAEERRLISSGSAIGARWGLVGQQRPRNHVHVRHAVWAAKALGQGAGLDQSVGADIGTEVDKDLAAHSEDRAVLAASDLNLAIRL